MIREQPAGAAGSYLPSLTARLTECRIDLYENKASDGWERLISTWQELRSARFLRIQRLRVAALHLRASVGIALAGGDKGDRAARQVRRDAAALERERLPWSRALAKLIHAAIKKQSGDEAGCRSLLGAASDELDRATMPAFAAAARFWRTKLSNDQSEQKKACEELRLLGAANPEQIAAMLAPGFE